MNVKMEQPYATPMPHVATLRDHTTAPVYMATVGMDSTAQVKDSSYKNFFSQLFSGINLCDVGPTDCHTDATCLDRDGGYDCECNNGYTGNGTHCEGIVFIFYIIL